MAKKARRSGGKASAINERAIIGRLPPWATDNWRWLAARLDNIDSKLASVQAALISLRQLEVKAMTAMDDAIANLTTVINTNTDVEASAVQTIQHLADLVAGAATDPAAVVALADKIKASADALGAAIANVNPANPAPAPAPAPAPEPTA